MRAGISIFALLLAAGFLHAAQPVPGGSSQHGVSATVHNLSVSGPGEIRSQTETEVCKFCHIPHNPVLNVPLWSHGLSQVVDYATPKLRRGGNKVEAAPQPDGSSRLCLSCHDGTVALGEIGPSRRVIPMGGAQRLGVGRRGYLGTNLSGGHPVSIPMPDAANLDDAADMGVRPAGSIVADSAVRLDSRRLMQCTTCHDPHSDSNYRPDRTPHFWVRPTVTEVCLSCHELR